MRVSRRTRVAGSATALAAAWGVAYRSDRRRILADPLRERLDRTVEGRSVTVQGAGGASLRVHVHGPEDGRTIVLVHGWTCAHRFWTLQVQELSRDHRVVVYDLRGHGENAPAADDDYSIDAYRDDLDHVLRETVPDGERPVLVGHSLGGMTIIAWAAAQGGSVADRVGAVGLLSTMATAALPPSAGLGVRLRHELRRAFVSSRAPVPRRSTPISARMVRAIALSPAASPATVAFCEQMILNCPRDVRAYTGRAITRLEALAGLDAIDVPAIALVGEDDRLTPPSHTRRLSDALTGLVERIELPRVGHMSPVEAPEQVTAVIRRLVAASAPTTEAGERDAAVAAAAADR